MKVLVIIPTHDRLQYLEEAKASVFAQTRRADELVITGNVGIEFPTDADLATRLNSALEASECDAFLNLCDDDLLEPEYIEKTAGEMERRGVDIVYTNCTVFGRDNHEGSALGTWTQENIDRNTVPLVTSLCTKAAWRRAGGFESLPLFDWHFWWKCFYTGASAFWLKEQLFRYRLHDQQDSNSIDLEAARAEIRGIHEQMKARHEFTRWQKESAHRLPGS